MDNLKTRKTYLAFTESHKNKFNDLIEIEDKTSMLNFLKKFHYSDIALLYSDLKYDHKIIFLKLLYNKIDPLFLTKLNDLVLEEIVQILGTQKIAKLLSKMDLAEVIDVLADLDKNTQEKILNLISNEIKPDLEFGLNYNEDQVERYMHKDFLSINENWNLKKIKSYLSKNHHTRSDNLFALFIVDHLYKPKGLILVNELFKYQDTDIAKDIMHKNFFKIDANKDIDDLIAIFKKYSLKSVAITDNYNRIIGVVNVSDIVEIIDETAEEDIFHLGGINESDIFTTLKKTYTQRLPWLSVNLLTAIIASIVIGIFNQTIEKLVALAILMPIIASMGGNAGTQSVTIAVRAIATKELNPTNYLKIIYKESVIGLFNGIIFGILCMICVYLIFHNMNLAFLFALATIITLTIAGLSGSLIPILIHKIKGDPDYYSGKSAEDLIEMQQENINEFLQPSKVFPISLFGFLLIGMMFTVIVTISNHILNK